MPRRAKATPPPDLPSLECACASVRRAARLITQLYAHEMGRVLEPSQFMLLSVLDHRPGIRQTVIGRALGFDKTTLSRNLSLMQRNGWIEHVQSGKERERGYKLTSAGQGLLAATKPGWSSAQRKLRAVMTGEEWENMFKVFGHAAKAALQAETQANQNQVIQGD